MPKTLIEILEDQVYKIIEDKKLSNAEKLLRKASAKNWQELFNILLIEAVKQPKLEIIEFLLKDKKANPNFQEAETGNTALFSTLLIDNGQMAVAELLFKYGADIKIKNNKGHTVLLGAVIENYVELVRCFADNGADINTQDSQGRFPLFYAALKNYIDIAKILIDKKTDVNISGDKLKLLLYLATKSGNFEIAELLIKNGASLESEIVRGEHKIPLLYVIVHESKGEIGKAKVKFLLDHGANPNIKIGQNEETVLHDAKNLKLLKLLLDYGANPNIVDKKGETPLQDIIFRFNKIGDDLKKTLDLKDDLFHKEREKIKILLKYGANIVNGNNIDELENTVKRLVKYEVSDEAIVTSLLIANEYINFDAKANLIIGLFGDLNIFFSEVISDSIFYYKNIKKDFGTTKIEIFKNNIKLLAEKQVFDYSNYGFAKLEKFIDSVIFQTKSNNKNDVTGPSVNSDLNIVFDDQQVELGGDTD